MTYDFDEIIERRGTHCVKWDESHDGDVLPMWVADMDFKAAPAIQAALRRRLEHGVFAYTIVENDYYDAITNWYRHRHNWTIKRQWILYTTGVVPAVSAVIKALTLPGDQVIMQTPAYNCFFSSIRNCGCEMVENRLVKDDKGRYSIDFDDLERKCSSSRARLLLLCNPHNPTGRLWSEDELLCINDICRRYNVRVVSDEIHGELTFNGQRYVPFGRVSEECMDNVVVCSSPSKAFNTAGLQMAHIICNNTEIRNRIDRVINIHEICDVNPFAPEAVKAAYNDSEEWLDELCSYVWGNYELLCRFVNERMPMLRVSPLEATYLAWIDITALGLTSDECALRMMRDCKVWVSSGTIYGAAGEGFVRMNLATQRSRVEEALRRIEKLKTER